MGPFLSEITVGRAPKIVLNRKIAFIDLQDGSVETKPVSLDLRRKFLGGRGINMYLISKYYSSILDPFSTENLLIFGAGLLTGTLGFGSRINITSKSPESGHLGDSNRDWRKRDSSGIEKGLNDVPLMP